MTTSRDNDTIWIDSSRGPVIGTSRKKPDLVAPGQAVIVACSEYPDTPCEGTPGVPENGTSLSAPMVAGGVALLASVGVSNPKAQKAILINSADGIDTQTTWQADAGWGQLAMDTAYAQRNNSVVSSIGANGAKFYEANVSVGDKATLTWHRRATFALVPPNMTTPKTIYEVTNLDLRQYTEEQVERASSTSTSADPNGEDNVEQVTSSNAETAIYKVDANSSIDGATSEEFGIAGTQSLTPRATPTVDQSVVQGETQVQQATDVVVQTTITNNGDLTAGDATATINYPNGVSLVSGAETRTQSVGGVDDDLQPSESHQASWTVRGTSDGLKQITIDAQGSSFGETWSSSRNVSLLVDSTGPTTAFGALDTYSTSNPVTVSLTSGDGSGAGVEQTQVEASIDSGAWQPHTTLPAGHTSLTFAGSEGSSYRFRSHATDGLSNTGDWSYSSTTTLDTQQPSLSLYALPTATLGQAVDVWVAATDAVSGVASRTYSLDGGPAQPFAGDQIKLVGLQTGSHNVIVSVSDMAGHSSTQRVDVSVLGSTVVEPVKKKSKVGKIKIKRKGRKLTVRATITKGVTGNVRITAKFYGKKPRSKRLRRKLKKAIKKYTKIRKRRFKKTFTVPARGRYKIVAKFRGSDSYKASKRTRRIRVK